MDDTKQVAELLATQAPADCVEAAEQAPASPVVYQTDRWTRRRAEWTFSELDESTRMELADSPELGEERPARHATDAFSDLFAVSYDPQAKRNERVTCPMRAEFLQGLEDSPEFASTRRLSEYDAVLAGEASRMLVGRWLDFVAAVQQHQEQEQQDEKPTPAPNPQMAGAAAGRQAAERVSQVSEQMDAMGCSLGSGEVSRQDLAGAVRMCRYLQRDAKWQKIVAWAGRFTSLARQLQRNKLTHGADEVVDRSLGGRLNRLAPSELARICDEDLGDEALIRLSENQCVVRELATVERQSLGPIVACVDESGSMRREKNAQARGLSLALAWLARAQRRPLMLATFSCGTGSSVYTWRPGEQIRPDELANWACNFNGGGTDAVVPIRRMPEMIKDHGMEGLGRIDYLIITDGIFEVLGRWAREFKSFKAAQRCEVTGILIGECRPNPPLRKVCDHWHHVAELAGSDAVNQVLSI